MNRRLLTVTLALGITAAGAVATAGSAAAASTGTFAPIHTVDFKIQGLAAPDGDTIVAVGTNDSGTSTQTVMAEARIDGVWVQQVLGPGDRVKVVSDDGVVWVLTTPYGDDASALYKSNGHRFEQVALPTDPAGEWTMVPQSIAVDGSKVVLSGAANKYSVVDGQRYPYSDGLRLATLKNNAWKVMRPSRPWALLGADDGRVLATTTSGSVTSSTEYVYDITAPSTPGWYGTAGSYASDVPKPRWSTAEAYQEVTLDTGYDFTLWGYRNVHNEGGITDSVVGLCKHFGGGTAVACPAPEFPVVAASRLADGRTVLAGNSQDRWMPARSGYAVAEKDGTITPVPGDASTVVDVAAAAFGTHAWSASTNVARSGAPDVSTIAEATLAG